MGVAALTLQRAGVLLVLVRIRVLTKARVKANVMLTPKVLLGLNVFTEKPVAEDGEDINAIFEHCAAAGVELMCGFQRRFDPS